MALFEFPGFSTAAFTKCPLWPPMGMPSQIPKLSNWAFGSLDKFPLLVKVPLLTKYDPLYTLNVELFMKVLVLLNHPKWYIAPLLVKV